MRAMNELEDLAQRLGATLLARGEWLAVAESCTGGWLAQSVTAIAGSSGWFDRGFVTYSNAAKIDMLGVPETTLERHGAVSEQTARAMVQGALRNSGADWAVAITGVAGPAGGSAEKPLARCVLPGPRKTTAAKPRPVISAVTVLKCASNRSGMA